ncbi:MAG: DUF72 domain-containing protein [Actinobacteria bacterium]|nr:DUF72 domain-containing protein [Actinomycetota bacterium]
MKSNLLIGTSGFSYNHWKNIFYPEDVKNHDWLIFYAKHFDTVEINSSFYHLPSKEIFTRWRKITPPNFIFSVKGSRFITHIKKLNEIEEPVENFLKNVSELKEKLGPILFQFPPNWEINLNRFENFLKILPDQFKYAFEFRNKSWFNNSIYSLLKRKKSALCISSSPSFPSEKIITSTFTFIRMHGGSEPYGSCYSTKELKMWAEEIREFLAQKIDVFVYFNNDAYGYAIKNALELSSLLL